jgi:hypothetical protein
MDNLRVHHAKLVKAWLSAKENRIQVFYLSELRTRPVAKSVEALKRIA